MSLICWIPLTNNTLNNQGIENMSVTNNGATYSSSGGKLGAGCWSFSDGTKNGHGISINKNFTNIGSNRSICAWVYPKGNHADYAGAIVSSGNWNSSRWSFGVERANGGFTGFDSGYSSYYSTSIPLNTWTHLCVTVADGVTKFYKNGIYLGQQSRGSGTVSSDASNTMIGRETYANGYFGFNGSIQDVRIYNHCLSEDEIHELSLSKVGHWCLDENSLDGQNLITSLISGGNCTVSGNNISVSGTNSDSYFQFNISEAMVENGLYKISCRGSGFPNGSYYNFPIAAQSNSGPGVLKIQNGYCQLIFVANNTIANAGTRILMDDNGRVAGAGTISDIRLVKLNKSCDISGNHNDLTINGTCSVSTGSKRYSKCINLPEATTLTCANPFAGQTTQQEWSISCWVKASALTNWSSKLNNFNYGNYLKTGDNQSILYLNAGTNDYYSYAAGCPQLNTWTHVVFVFRNSDGLRQVWINGVQKASNGPNKTSTPLGMPATIEWFTAYGGDVSDLRLYATALSSSDVQYLYSLGN